MKKLVTTCTLLLLILTAFAGHVSADDSGIALNFVFQPTNLVVDAKQGDTFKKDIFLMNKSKASDLQVRLYIENFKPVDGGNTVSFYTTNDGATNMASWIKPEISIVHLKPQEQQYETLDFSIPDFVKPGTYTGIVFVEQVVGDTNHISNTKVVARAGINILVNISKDDAQYSSLYKSTVVQDFGVSFFNQSKPALYGRIVNTGVFAVANEVVINITNVFGKSVKSYDYSGIDVLPYSYRYLDGKHATVTLDGMSPGVYNAELILKDNVHGTSTHYTQYFTICPIYLTIILSLIVVILIALTIYAIHRNTSHKS